MQLNYHYIFFSMFNSQIVKVTLFYIQRQQIAAKSLSLQRLHLASIFAFSPCFKYIVYQISSFALIPE